MNEGNGRNMEDEKTKEVAPRASRRTFSREYKLRIVREAEKAKKHGGVGALLRREGLYSSTLVQWRREFPLDGEVSLEPEVFFLHLLQAVSPWAIPLRASEAGTRCKGCLVSEF